VDTIDAEAIERVFFDLNREQLIALVRRANHEYWDLASPTLPDPLYDRLVERLRAVAPGASVLRELGPGAPSEQPLSEAQALEKPPEARLGASVRHNRPMLSLDKCYRLADLQSWANKFEGEVLAMPKLDGIACSLRYGTDGTLRLAVTRGTGWDGDDITQNALDVPDIPRKLTKAPGEELEIRGELFMRLTKFAKYRQDFANPRNLTAGTIKTKERTKGRARDLSFFAYDLLGKQLDSEREKLTLLSELGFLIVDHRFVERDDLQAAFEQFLRARTELDYELDGVVYRASLLREHRRLGETAHHPRYAIAYKFQGDTGDTTLNDVLWSVSRTGAITPVAVLEPIELSGAMIGRASLHNLTQFRQLELTKGCRVQVTRRGGVIPNVETVVEAGPGGRPFEVPTTCPACGSPAEVRQKHTAEFLMCTRPQGCITARLRELLHFAAVVDLQGFGPKVIHQCVDAGLLNGPADIYKLRNEDLVTLERLGTKSAANLIAQVETHRELALATFLQSLGIDHLGPQYAQLLARRFGTLERIRNVTVDELLQLRGIKHELAGALIAGLSHRKSMIDALLEQVQVLDEPLVSQELGPLAGQSFVFTGTLEGLDRKRAQERVRALGGDTPASVTRELTTLVVGRGHGDKSSKRKRAESFIATGAPIEIIDEDAFSRRLIQLESELTGD